MLSRRMYLVAIIVFSVWGNSAQAWLMPPVTVNGREWLQPVDFTLLDWPTISAVCDPVSGVCNGSLNGYDVTGYRWAGINAVFEMISTFTELPPGQSGFYGSNSTWAPLFLQSFAATDIDPGRSMVIGLVRETEDYGGLIFEGTINVVDGYYAPFNDSVSLNPSGAYGAPSSSRGGWFYRDAVAAVSAPATLSLAVLSLTILTVLRRTSSNPR